MPHFAFPSKTKNPVCGQRDGFRVKARKDPKRIASISGKIETMFILSVDDSDFTLADNCKLAGQVGPVGHNQKAQKYFRNLITGHPIKQHNNHARAILNIETENVPKAAVKADNNQAALLGVFKNCLIVSADQAGLPRGRNFVTGSAQGRNQISVDAFIGKKAKHKGLSGFNFQQFFLAKNAGRVIKGGLNIILGDAGVLRWNFAYAVAGAQEMQNIGHGNARASYAWLAEPHFLFNDNAVADISRPSCFLNLLEHKPKFTLNEIKLPFLLITNNIMRETGCQGKWSKINPKKPSCGQRDLVVGLLVFGPLVGRDLLRTY